MSFPIACDLAEMDYKQLATESIDLIRFVQAAHVRYYTKMGAAILQQKERLLQASADDAVAINEDIKGLEIAMKALLGMADEAEKLRDDYNDFLMTLQEGAELKKEFALKKARRVVNDLRAIRSDMFVIFHGLDVA